MIGRLLGGRYEIVKRIGGGGMSIVYQARCTILNRPVAVKILRQQYAEDDEFIRRFRREALAAASLTHPNIVGIYDVGEESGIHYIVMEHVEGETLRDRMKRSPIKPAEAVDIAIQICDALSCAHRARVIHRDIKPLNIMITDDGRVKVADFGIAHAAAVSPITSDGTVLGSAHYLSPEQAQGRTGNHRSDIYSLGAVLYEMVTGRVPFDGEAAVAVAMKHVTDEPIRPSKISGAVAPVLEAIILKALAKKPDDRYDSAQDMKRALQEFIGAVPRRNVAGDGEGGSDDMPGSEEKRPRRWGVWIAVMVVLALLGTGLGFGARWIDDWFNVPTVTLPDVVGMDIEEAERKLTELGLEVSVIAERYDDDFAPDTVITQSPRSGETVRTGRVIELVVSLGQRLVQGGVPEVVRLHYRQAEAMLLNAGLTVGRITREHHSSVPADYVVSQNPRPGSDVPQGTAVDLEISLGPVPVRMPDLVGQSLITARHKLAELDLEEGTITEEPSNQAEGTVLSHYPLPGEMVTPGTVVDLVVSSGPQITEHQSVISINVPGTQPGLRSVVVELTDITGRRVIYDEKHRSGERFELTVIWRGETAQLRVFVDNNLIGEQVWP